MKHCGNTCAACGYRHLEHPQRAPSGGASYEICPSCGFESGYTDDDQGISYEQWRERWVASGCRWFSASVSRPARWNPLKDVHALLNRKRPVVPAIRLKRAAELLQQGMAEAPPTEAKAPAPKAKAAKPSAGKKASK